MSLDKRMETMKGGSAAAFENIGGDIPCSR